MYLPLTLGGLLMVLVGIIICLEEQKEKKDELSKFTVIVVSFIALVLVGAVLTVCGLLV